MKHGQKDKNPKALIHPSTGFSLPRQSINNFINQSYELQKRAFDNEEANVLFQRNHPFY